MHFSEGQRVEGRGNEGAVRDNVGGRGTQRVRKLSKQTTGSWQAGVDRSQGALVL